jgi:Flp pilus assembly protein TadD
MSLLNNVLRDLQGRGAFGLPPLTGLEPVSEIPDQHRKRVLLLPALAVLTIASAVLVWQPMGDDRGILSLANIMTDTAPQPTYGPQSDAIISPQTEPAIAATGADLRDISNIDSTAIASEAPRDDYVADTVTDLPPASAATVDSALAEPLPAAESPQVATSLPVTESPSVTEPSPVTESPPVAAMQESPPIVAAKESPPAATVKESPAEIEPTGTTTISRRQVDADDTSGTVAMALAAMRSNDLYTAERLFRDALAVDSGDHAIWSYLYGVLVRASRPDAAEQALQQGLVLANESAALAKLYARMLMDRGDKDAAVVVLKNHRPTPASDTEYDAFLGALLQQRGQYAEAGSIYENLIIAEPNSGSAWIGLAMSHDSLGNREDAVSAFESALRSGSLKTPLARYATRRVAELAAYD